MNPSVCRHLRTKLLYVPGQIVQAREDPEDAGTARHCWCNKTMTPVGLDDCRVNADACSDPTRRCYQPGG